MKKLSNTEAGLKKGIAYKESMFFNLRLPLKELCFYLSKRESPRSTSFLTSSKAQNYQKPILHYS